MTNDNGSRQMRFSCPFDDRLARTPYLVLPKLALQAMPFEWRDRFEAMLAEMDDTGMETPVYEVVLRGGEIRQKRCRDEQDGDYGEIVPVVSVSDEWANYRYGSVEELCPGFRRPHDPESFRAFEGHAHD